MKTCGGSGSIAPPLLTSALDGCEWLASRPGRFIPGKREPGTHRIEGWVGPRARLDAMEKRKILSCRKSNPDRPARNPLLYRLNYPGSVVCSTCLLILNYLFLRKDVRYLELSCYFVWGLNVPAFHRNYGLPYPN
jgi:hypothetical protein